MRGSAEVTWSMSQRLYARESATSTSGRGVNPSESIGVGKRQV